MNLTDVPRFRMFKSEIDHAVKVISTIRPNMSDEQAFIARDVMGHLVRALRAAEDEIARLKTAASGEAT